jgi:hypothetical protein
MQITKYLGIIILSVSIILSGILFFLLHKYNIHGIRRKHDIIKIIVFQIVMLVGGIILLLIKPPLGSGSNTHCDLSGLKNVYIFKETDDPITLLNTLDQINTLQGSINGNPHGASETSCSHPGGTNIGQWSTNRFVLLFLPGTYSVSFQIPYYVSVIGCGRSPEDVIFNGGPSVYNNSDNSPSCNNSSKPKTKDWIQCPCNNGLNNFWRSCENITIIPNETVTWAVSQASPMRKVHIKGNLTLFDLVNGDTNPMTSGGFMSDCKIDGILNSGSQQQFIFRNCTFGNKVSGGVWNMVYLNCDFGSNSPPSVVCHQIPQPPFPLPPGWKSTPNSIIEHSKPIINKPIFFYEKNIFKVLVTTGNVINNGIQWDRPTKDLIVCDDFYVATPSDTSNTINTQINNGKHILFTAGIYNNLTSSIIINKPNIILLGIGYPTLVSNSSDFCISVGDVENVTLAGLLIQSGDDTTTLCQFGSSSKSANSGYIYDLFMRVGGPDTKKTNATTMLEINSNNVICDNLWLWRADHGVNPSYIGWTQNTCDTGLIVNGDKVSIYGLAVEHTQTDMVVWNGDEGYVCFYQSEFPYDPPASSLPSYNDTVSFRVNGSKFNGFGFGAYCYFNYAKVAIKTAFDIRKSSTNTIINPFIVYLGSEPKTPSSSGPPYNIGSIQSILTDSKGIQGNTPVSTHKNMIQFYCA